MCMCRLLRIGRPCVFCQQSCLWNVRWFIGYVTRGCWVVAASTYTSLCDWLRTTIAAHDLAGSLHVRMPSLRDLSPDSSPYSVRGSDCWCRRRPAVDAAPWDHGDVYKVAGRRPDYDGQYVMTVPGDRWRLRCNSDGNLDFFRTGQKVRTECLPARSTFILPSTFTEGGMNIQIKSAILCHYYHVNHYIVLIESGCLIFVLYVYVGLAT